LSSFATTAKATNSGPPTDNDRRLIVPNTCCAKPALLAGRATSSTYSRGYYITAVKNCQVQKSSHFRRHNTPPKSRAQNVLLKKRFLTSPYIILWGIFSKKTSFSRKKFFTRLLDN
jgi:hypothetical protein